MVCKRNAQWTVPAFIAPTFTSACSKFWSKPRRIRVSNRQISQTPTACTTSATNFSSSANTATTKYNTPLLDALATETQHIRANFFCPGHKQGNTLPKPLESLLGTQVFKADLPELPALDNLFAPEGPLASAQNLASDAFTTDGSAIWSTHFLVNGTTCGIQAAFLACVQQSDHVLLPRNAHQSAVHALVQTGATPIWLDPIYDAQNDLLHGISSTTVREAFDAHAASTTSGNSTPISTILIISPTYHGVVSNINEIARIAHMHGARVIVDEAHGAHLHFHDALPASATECDADVVVQSTHKTLTAFTQAAVMHVRRSSMNEARIRSALQVVQSTSPNYLLLSSLDATRALMQTDGQQLLTRTIQLARQCTKRIANLDGFSVLGYGEHGKDSNLYNLDATRITVLLPPNVTGYEIDTHLIDRFGVYAELPSFRHITFVLTIGTTQDDVDTLITSLHLYNATSGEDTPFAHGFWLDVPVFHNASEHAIAMTPRQAFFAPSISIPTEKAVGRISADTLCPYPPGIPVLVPGEIVTEAGIRVLKSVLGGGGSVSGASDNTLSILRVVDEDSITR